MRNRQVFVFVVGSALIAIVASAMAQDGPPPQPPSVEVTRKAGDRVSGDTYARQDRPSDGPPEDVLRRPPTPERVLQDVVRPRAPVPPVPPVPPVLPEPPVSPEDVEEVGPSTDAVTVYRPYVNRLFRTGGGVGDGGGRNPEVVLNSKVQTLLRKLEAAKEPGLRNSIIEELRGVVNQQFGLRLDRQARDVQALEAKVKNLKELIAKREKNRDEIVTRKLEQLIRDSEGLGF